MNQLKSGIVIAGRRDVIDVTLCRVSIVYQEWYRANTSNS